MKDLCGCGCGGVTKGGTFKQGHFHRLRWPDAEELRDALIRFGNREAVWQHYGIAARAGRRLIKQYGIDCPATHRQHDAARWLKAIILEPSGCWGHAIVNVNSHGYRIGQFQGQRKLAHRLAYELLIGPIPDGLELDHLCRNPACINPDHLEPVTHAENVRRGRLAATGSWSPDYFS